MPTSARSSSGLLTKSASDRSASVYSRSSSVYTPSSSARTVTQAAASYPAPPVEYAKPIAPQGPIAKTPADEAIIEMPVTARVKTAPVAVAPNAFSTSLAHAAATHSAYVPTQYNNLSAITPLASRINYGLAW